jgi:hypothetical protein
LAGAFDAVFFSGHGSAKPPAFYLVDGSRLSPEELGRMIAEGPSVPLFAAFWACDTARAPEDSRGLPSPPFYEALARSGIGSVLAMQAPITDRGATLLAQEVLQSLAAGDSLDGAAARARSVLLDAQKAADGDDLDWACPVVWSSGLPTAKLAWNVPASQLAQLQTASRRARLKRDGRVHFPPTLEELDFARRWTASRLCWVKGFDLAGHKERWIRVLLAAQTVLSRYVVAVEFETGYTDVAEALMLWAEELQATLEPGDAAVTDFRTVLELLRHRPRQGWSRLCSLPDALISIWNPPSYGTEEWFWNPLKVGEARAIVVGETIDGRLLTDGWSVEELEMVLNANTLEQAHAEAPVLSDALALLALPVPRSSIMATGSSLEASPTLNGLTLTTAAGEVFLSSSAARFFRTRMNQEGAAAAHRACMQILDHASITGRLTPAIREERMSHCLGASENGAAGEEASALLVRYRSLDRPHAAIGVMRRVGRLWRDLPSNLLLIPAWAHTMLGEMTEASLWLDRSSADDPLERAWGHGLRAEILKASGGEGAKQAALNQIDAAIHELTQVPGPTRDSLIVRRLRAYRQDHARILQYLFHDSRTAAGEYRALLNEWRGEDDAAIDVAIVLRNYYECLRTGHQPTDSEWQEGKDMLGQAEQLLQDRPDHPVFAEILYEKARIGIAEGNENAQDLLRSARAAAADSGHLMLSAITAARYFWEFETFNLNQWTHLEADLSAFPRHGWAVRTLLNGRLRAAKRIADKAVARQLIHANLMDLEQNPSFDGGSDRFRIVASSAGDDLLAPGPHGEGRWEQFLKRPWAQDWLRQNGLQSPQDVWQRVP